MSKADYKQLEQAQQQNSEADKVTAAALAPSEQKEDEGKGTKEVQVEEKRGLTKVPPESAIAGKLIRLWVNGGVDGVELVSKL